MSKWWLRIWALKGSSPRIRGEWRNDHWPRLRAGIIPANTGRMSSGSCWNTSSRDHPREYGENERPARRDKDLNGSSPRIRGECCHCVVSTLVRGIIPANTGRIGGVVDIVYESPDHPREYGENRSVASADMIDRGSSPRIRGESR